MSLREDMETDLDEVFLCLDDFGEIHEVNGEKIPVIFDETELERLTKRLGEDAFPDDVHQGSVLMFAKAADIGTELHPGEMMTVDGRERFIQQAKRVGTLWRIIMGRRML